jgi:hypothetical protein
MVPGDVPLMELRPFQPRLKRGNWPAIAGVRAHEAGLAVHSRDWCTTAPTLPARSGQVA